MILDVLTKTGEKKESIELNKSLFELTPNLDLIKQYIRVYLANQRQGTSNTLNRSDVRRSGKKLWRQKGTGRARMGELSSPVFKGGAVAHGPHPKSWNLRMSKRMRINALFSALSLKALNKEIIVLDSLNIESPKTSIVAELIKNLNIDSRTLFVTDQKNENLLKASSNIKKTKVSNVSVLNAYEIVSSDKIVFDKDSVIALENKYENK